MHLKQIFDTYAYSAFMHPFIVSQVSILLKGRPGNGETYERMGWKEVRDSLHPARLVKCNLDFEL